MESVANTAYPNLRRASRTLELAYPEADVELREELAYLVSARRRTIQDALNYLADKSNVIRSSRTTSPEPQPQTPEKKQQDKLVPVPSSLGVTTRQHENSSSRERQFLSLPSPNKYKYHDNINKHTNNGSTIDKIMNSKKSDYVKYTLPSHSQSQENTPSTTFSFPHHDVKNNEPHKNNGYTLHHNVFKLPRDCAPSQNHIHSSNNNSVYKKYEGKNVSVNKSNNTTDNEYVLPSITSKGKEMIDNESHNNNSTSKNNSVIFPNIQSHSNGTRSSQHHLYTNIINNVSSSSNYNSKKYHYVYGDNAEKFEEEIIGQGGQVILYVTSMTGEQRVRDHCRALETLLYLKEVPYHLVDIADNALLQRRIRLIYEKATHSKMTPHMPQLCVDDTLIGDYEQVQEKEDNNCFIDALREAGAKDLPSHIVLSKVCSSNNMSNESKGITASLTNRTEKSKVNNSSIAGKSNESMEKKATNQMCNGISKTTFIEKNDSNMNVEVSVANTKINECERKNDDEKNLEKSKNKAQVANLDKNEINKIGNSDNSNDSSNVDINRTSTTNINAKKNNAKNTTNNVIVVSNGVNNIQGDNNNNNTHNECNCKGSKDSITPLPSASSFVTPPASILIKRSSFTTSTPNNSAGTSAFLKHAVVKNNNTSNNSISNNNIVNNKPTSREITRPVNALARVGTQLPATNTATSSSLSSLLPQIK